MQGTDVWYFENVLHCYHQGECSSWYITLGIMINICTYFFIIPISTKPGWREFKFVNMKNHTLFRCEEKKGNALTTFKTIHQIYDKTSFCEGATKDL